MLTEEQVAQVKGHIRSQAVAAVEVEIAECEERLRLAQFDLEQARAKLVSLKGTLNT